jgi:hypothetical protein
MANLDSAIQELREQRRATELQMEKLDSAISVLQSLTGGYVSVPSNNGVRPKRIISTSARRRMALAQKARRSKERQSTTGEQNTKRTPRLLSAQARRKIAAAQRARWARVRSQGAKKAA